MQDYTYTYIKLLRNPEKPEEAITISKKGTLRLEDTDFGKRLVYQEDVTSSDKLSAKKNAAVQVVKDDPWNAVSAVGHEAGKVAVKEIIEALTGKKTPRIHQKNPYIQQMAEKYSEYSQQSIVKNELSLLHLKLIRKVTCMGDGVVAIHMEGGEQYRVYFGVGRGLGQQRDSQFMQELTAQCQKG